MLSLEEEFNWKRKRARDAIKLLGGPVLPDNLHGLCLEDIVQYIIILEELMQDADSVMASLENTIYDLVEEKKQVHLN